MSVAILADVATNEPEISPANCADEDIIPAPVDAK